MNDLVVATIAIEDQVSTFSGFSVELTTKDLQKWIKAYSKDKAHVVAYTKLR